MAIEIAFYLFIYCCYTKTRVSLCKVLDYDCSPKQNIYYLRVPNILVLILQVRAASNRLSASTPTKPAINLVNIDENKYDTGFSVTISG